MTPPQTSARLAHGARHFDPIGGVENASARPLQISSTPKKGREISSWLGHARALEAESVRARALGRARALRARQTPPLAPAKTRFLGRAQGHVKMGTPVLDK